MSSSFSLLLLQWFLENGRKDLPWQHPRTPYRVWIAEIMLQQTQVKTVIPYFQRFIQTFPELCDLACAQEDDVLALWSGLGYYSRARNLLKTAKIIAEQFNGVFPQELRDLISLPGIGESTAAAIASQAFNLPTAILDGNVKRVLSRYFMVDGIPGKSETNKKLWKLAKACMPQDHCVEYTQAIMDLGATCCTQKKPRCEVCPVQLTCLAKKNNCIEQYPFKKEKKIIPSQNKLFLLLYDENKQIYLHKRPPVGIWGGLWCLPIVDEGSDPRQYLSMEQEQEQNELKIHKLTQLVHTFSHFRLNITAYALQTSQAKWKCSESMGQWFNKDQLTQLGLAKPVTKIIEFFYNS